MLPTHICPYTAEKKMPKILEIVTYMEWSRSIPALEILALLLANYMAFDMSFNIRFQLRGLSKLVDTNLLKKTNKIQKIINASSYCCD